MKVLFGAAFLFLVGPVFAADMIQLQVKGQRVGNGSSTGYTDECRYQASIPTKEFPDYEIFFEKEKSGEKYYLRATDSVDSAIKVLAQNGYELQFGFYERTFTPNYSCETRNVAIRFR